MSIDNASQFGSRCEQTGISINRCIGSSVFIRFSVPLAVLITFVRSKQMIAYRSMGASKEVFFTRGCPP